MSFKSDFVDNVKKAVDDGTVAQGYRPNIEVWPEEDDFGRWVAFHENKVRAVICTTPEFADTPFCARGSH
jgi:hypothetical protein